MAIIPNKFLQHKNISRGNIHGVVNWIFVDTAAMTAADVDLTFRDLGKVAKNNETGQYFLLDSLQPDGTPVWVRVDSPAAAGEANTASNEGTGTGIYKQKSGVNIQFRSLLGTAQQVSVNVSASGDEVVLGIPSTFTLSWGRVTSTPTTLVGYGITDAAPAVHSHAVVTAVDAGFMSPPMLAHLSGIEAGATANSSDNYLLDLANATGNLPANRVLGLSNLLLDIGNYIDVVAGESIVEGEFVSLQNGKAYKEVSQGLLGVAIAYAEADEPLKVQRSGIWNLPIGSWNPGPVYLDMDGTLSQSASVYPMRWKLGYTPDGAALVLAPQLVSSDEDFAHHSFTMLALGSYIPAPWNLTFAGAASITDVTGTQVPYKGIVAEVDTAGVGDAAILACEVPTAGSIHVALRARVRLDAPTGLYVMRWADGPGSGTPTKYVQWVFDADADTNQLMVETGTTTEAVDILDMDTSGWVDISVVQTATGAAVHYVNGDGTQGVVSIPFDITELATTQMQAHMIATSRNAAPEVLCAISGMKVYYLR